MINAGLYNFLFISIPEEFLVLIITLLAIGFKYHKVEVAKFLLVTVLTATCSTLIHNYFGQFQISVFGQLLFFVIVYSLVFRIKWYKVLTATTFAFMFCAITEFIGISIMTLITGISYSQLVDHYSNTLLFVAYSIPGRLIQIIGALILYKLPFTLLNFDKVNEITKDVMNKIKIVHIILLLNLYLIATQLNSLISTDETNIYTLLYLALNVAVAIILFILLIRFSINLNRQIGAQRSENLHSLLWCKAIIDDSNGDILLVKKNIDDAIKEIKMNGRSP